MMTEVEVSRYRALLQSWEAEFGDGLRKRKGIAIEQAPDTMDAVMLAAEREFTIRQLDREAALLKLVRAALGRVAEGTFGICVECEAEINSKRLAVAPWAAYCRPCQEITDARRRLKEMKFRRVLSDAA